MRAVFLAAIMVISMVGMSVALSGAAAASSNTQPDFTPDNPYQGVTVDAENSSGGNIVDGEDYDLRIVNDYDDDTVDSSSFVEELTADEDGLLEIETDDLEAGEDYFIIGGDFTSPRTVDQDETFEVRSMRLDVDFDEDEVTDAGDSAVTEIEFDSNRGTYNVTVNAEGDLEEEDLNQIFSYEGNFDVNETLSPDELDDLDDDYDLDQEDAIVLKNVSDDEEDISFDDIDTGDYEFNFDSSDAIATSSDSITVREEDDDGEFSQGTYDTGAGDIANFEFELDDTDEAWIQIGDADSDFVDVLYVEVDEEDEEVEVAVNTRLLGAPGDDVDTDAVYDHENTDEFESILHSENFDDANNTHQLFHDDGDPIDTVDYYDELDLVDEDDITTSSPNGSDIREEMLTRPLQAIDYELQLASDGDDDGVFDADAGAGEASDQLDASVLELQAASIGEINTWVAPEENADDEDDVEELLEIVTQRDEVANGDRLVVEVEATGLYGGLIAGGPNSTDDGAATIDDSNGVDFDRLEDGVSTDLVEDAFEADNIHLDVEAEDITGQDAIAVDLDSDDEDVFMLIGPDQDRFFLIVDSDSDDAFTGSAPESKSFTAEFEFDADDEDDRFEFADENEPFNVGQNYPYLQAGDTLEASAAFEFVESEINFDNLNADDEIQAENIEDSEITGTTNIAPGSDATLRVSSTDASTSFRIGQDVDINEDGEVSAEYDFSGQEVDDEFDTRFRASGSTVDTVDSVIVAEGDLGVEDPVEDDEDDVVDDDDDVVDDDDDDVVDDDDDDVVDDDDDVEEPTDDETPGFGALVALVALIGAALLAVRRQNN